LNYVAGRFEQYSSEIQQASNLPSISELIRPQRSLSPNDIASMNRIQNETVTQKEEIKRF